MVQNLVQSAVDLHIDRLEAVAGISIVLRIGSVSVSLTGIPGRSQFTRDDGVEDAGVESGSFDWLVRTSKLVLDGSPLKIGHGMWVENVETGARYDVRAGDQSSLADFNDANGQLTRIHTVLRERGS